MEHFQSLEIIYESTEELKARQQIDRILSAEDIKKCNDMENSKMYAKLK